jgi:regulation of enolase protein 1 (concanavalin A-like superfamily)
MKHFVLYIIIGLGIGFSLTAQPAFERLHGTPDNWDYHNYVKQLPDKSFLLGGGTRNFFAESDSAYTHRMFLTHLDSTGSLIQRKYYPFHNEESNIYGFYDINNGYTMLHGHSSILQPLAPQKMYLSYVNSDTFKNIYMDAVKPNAYVVRNVILNKRQQFVFHVSYGMTQGDSFYICATDTQGKRLWLKEYLSTNIQVLNLVQAHDGGYFLSGYLLANNYRDWKDGTLQYFGHPSRLWLAKLDSLGNEQWQKIFSGNFYEPRGPYAHIIGPSSIGAHFNGITPLSDGTYMAYGQVNVFPYMAKLSENGDVLWHEKIDTARIAEQQIPEDIHKIIDRNGSLYALAYKESYYKQLWKLTYSGKCLWKRDYYHQYNILSAILAIESVDDGFVMVGAVKDTNTWDVLPQQGWIIKTDTNGCIKTGCHLNDSVDVSIDTLTINRKTLSINIYPNPANQVIRIQHSLTKASLKIVNTLGETVYQTQDIPHELNTSQLGEGIYFLVVQEGQLQHKHKLLIQHP